MDYLLTLLLVVLSLAGLGIAAFFVLKRLFERAADRVADHIGGVIGNLASQTARTPRRPAPAAARAVDARLTRLGAYAAAGGMSEDAARREFAESIERIARLMDAAIRLPIIGPVGLDALLGLFPVAGDVLSAAIAVSLIARSLKYGVPAEIIARMLGNVLFDMVIGAVPVAGDVADLWFRANMRNVELLRKFLDDQARDTIDIHL